MLSRQLFAAMLFLALSLCLLTACSPDCEWDAEIETWVDADENEVWDAGEPPLPNVKCSLESHNAIFTTDAVSDVQGKGHLHMMLAGCPDKLVIVVFVQPPSGYVLSSQTHAPATENAQETFQFGFVPINE